MSAAAMVEGAVAARIAWKAKAERRAGPLRDEGQTHDLQELCSPVADQIGSTAVEWAITTVQGLLEPVILSCPELKQYAGDYGPYTVLIIQDHLQFRGWGTEYRMIPIGHDTFMLQGVYARRLRFLRDDAGFVFAVVTVTQEGTGDLSARTFGSVPDWRCEEP